jgi:hypothetical protein
VSVLVVHAVTQNNSKSDQAMGNWMSSYGSTYLAVAHDTGAVNNSTNTQSLRSACVKLQGEVTQAQADPPMPIGSLEQQWSTILSNLSTSSNDCVEGIDQQSNNLLNTAQNHERRKQGIFAPSKSRPTNPVRVASAQPAQRWGGLKRGSRSGNVTRQ